MTWQFLAFVFALIMLVAYLLNETLRARNELQGLQVKYHNINDRHIEICNMLSHRSMAYTELAGRFMELETLVDGAIGQGQYPPDAVAWRELADYRLDGAAVLRPFGA